MKADKMKYSFPPERLYNCNGRDLRRALFSLKQIFQVAYVTTRVPVLTLFKNVVSIIFVHYRGVCVGSSERHLR